MYPKQKSYIPRFALLLNSFQSFFDDVTPANEITVESILKAEKISDYFVSNARKIKLESSETNTIKQAIKKAETSTEKIKAIYFQDADFNRSKVAEILGISRQYIQQIIKKIEDNEKNA
jgi:DNA-directed RNA polymerase specialized sigma subunit